MVYNMDWEFDRIYDLIYMRIDAFSGLCVRAHKVNTLKFATMLEKHDKLFILSKLWDNLNMIWKPLQYHS